MKRLKIIAATVLTAVCVFAVCLFAGCNIDYAAIYNDNAKIIKSNRYSSVASVEVNNKNDYSYSCSKFSGVKEIKSFTVKTDSALDMKLNVESGDFKLVLADKSNVYVLQEGSYDGRLAIENVPNGAYKLKMVGVAAEFKLEINF